MTDILLDSWALLFDGVLALLLLATVVYAAILNRKLSLLRDSRQEMERSIGRFAEATARAEGVLAQIRRSAGETGRTLQEAIDRGNVVADDLVFLAERAGGLADRLEGAVAAKPAARRKDGRAATRYDGRGPAAGQAGGAFSEDAAVPPPAVVGEAGADEGSKQSAFMKTLRGMR